jgi:hypothetical protein
MIFLLLFVNTSAAISLAYDGAHQGEEVSPEVRTPVIDRSSVSFTLQYMSQDTAYS